MKSSLSKIKLYDFITKEKVDIPLIEYNPDETVGLLFGELDSETRIEIIQQILRHLLSTDPFWVCDYGKDNGKTFLENHFFSREPTIEVLEYHSELIDRSEIVDRDWFDYKKDAIACVQTALPEFSLDAYLRYALDPDYPKHIVLNTIFLINPDKGFAVWICDWYGRCIMVKDANLRLELEKKCVFPLRSRLGVCVKYRFFNKPR